MGERSRVREVKREESAEERSVVAFYEALLSKIESMYLLSRTMENTDALAGILGCLAVTVVQINVAIDKAREEARMAYDAQQYEAREGVKDE